MFELNYSQITGVYLAEKNHPRTNKQARHFLSTSFGISYLHRHYTVSI